jgi:transcriptional regulator with XRE-family HTH domain
MARRRGDEFENSEVFLEVQGALARKIKRLRLDRDLSQRQLASIADVSGPHFGLIEAGVGNVSLLVLVKIAKALGVSVADLFEGAGSGKSGVDSAIVRLSGTLEKVEKHLERRRDEFARFGDELKDFMREHRGGSRAIAVERGPEPVGKTRRQPKSASREEGPD